MLGPWFDSLSPEAQAEVLALVRSEVAEALQSFSYSTASPWLSVQAAADHLGVSEGSIRSAVKRNVLPAHRLERRVLLRVEDVDRLPTAASAGKERSSTRRSAA